jgi:CheY-like chemotaxis protein
MLLISVPVFAEAINIEKDATPENLWTDAIYFIKIGRMEYGKSYLQAYIDRKVDPIKTLEFSEKDPRSVQILTQLQNDPSLAKLARTLLDEIDKGWQLKRRDITRIEGEIERLSGNPRAQFQATERLRETGEYAVPVILENLIKNKDQALRAKLIDTLVALGPSAIEPLIASMTDIPDTTKLAVYEAIGRLDYSQPLPYLKAAVENKDNSEVIRAAAAQAIQQIVSRNPKYRSDESASEGFLKLALLYYYQDTSVKPSKEVLRVAGLAGDISSEKPNIWIWKDGKLMPQPVAWEIYYDLMTMRMTRKSLEIGQSAGHRQALTYWLMANCRRESKLSEKISDPFHSKDFPTSYYFFSSSGTRYCLEALNHSLKDGDMVISIASLAALRDIASGNQILSAIENNQPIVSALTNPNELIRMYSALAIGWAVPTDKYPSSEDVVPLLGKVISGSSKHYSMVIIKDNATRESLKKMLKDTGTNVSSSDNFLSAADDLKKHGPNMELIVLDYDLTTPGIGQAVRQIRSDSSLKFVPVIVMVSTEKMNDAGTVLGKQTGLAILPNSSEKEAIISAMGELKKSLGRMTLDDAAAKGNALSAAKALERLAEKSSDQYKVENVRSELTRAVSKADWELALVCAKVLSLLSSQTAQQNLADEAMNRKDAEQKVTLLSLLNDSVRRHGGKLSEKQISGLQELVISEKDGSLRKASSKVLGSLNLDPNAARNVILSRDPFGKIK